MQHYNLYNQYEQENKNKEKKYYKVEDEIYSKRYILI